MAVLTLKESCFTYRVATGDPCLGSWSFTIVVNQNGTIGVRNITSPYGLLCNSMAQIPQDVLQAIQTAQNQVQNLVAQTSAINGTLNFVNQVSQSVVFSTPFVDTSYRVYVTLQDFIDYRITNKTTTGFDVELNVTYTGPVQYDVFV
jgi:hypothetical protein